MIARKVSIYLAAVLFCSIGALAQDAGENPCLNDKTTADNGSNAGVRMCFTELQHKIMKEIDLLVFQQARELYAAADEIPRNVHQPREVHSENSIEIESALLFRRSARALELSQARWKVYRQGYCRAVEAKWTTGSGAPGAYEECMYNLAIQRKKELLRDFGNPPDAH